MFEPGKTDFKVSVVLSAYKKPDVLKEQLDAIEAQTLKPKEIFLFQDGIAENYKVSFSQEILNRFDKHVILNENKGVWERFKFAQGAASKYVCIFDDDTVPGKRWLENCHFNSMYQDGVYGTVGILIKDFKTCSYPYGVGKGYYRFGWPTPLNKTIGVDFAGHSWFLRTEYLKYMFDNTEKYQEFKYAAEDMCLSFKCAQHGIKTFTPPHPYNDEELWGSRFAVKYGTMPTAISLNSESFDRMRSAFDLFVQAGWADYSAKLFEPNEKKNAIYYARYETSKSAIKKFLKRVIRKLKRIFAR